MENKISKIDKKIFENFKPSDLPKKTLQRLLNPLRPFKSRMYGYKSKPGYLAVLLKMKKGGIEARIPSRGRTPSNIYKKYSRSISKIDIAQQKVSRKYPTLKVLGGYLIAENGQNKWYEFILKDPLLAS